MSPILKHLYSQTYTVVDIHRRLRLMQEVLETVLYNEPQQMRVSPLTDRLKQSIKTIADEADAPVLLSLDEALWNTFSPATAVARFKTIREEAEALPVMKLYIPVHFTDVQLAPIAQWVRSEVAPGLLLEITVDPKVVGGCAFVYKDTHFDWSLRRYLRAKKGMITSLLNAYGD